MLRMSKLTDYATVILASLAQDADRRRTAGEIALASHLAPPTASKLLKQLQRAGLVESTRGLRGGYRLARPAQKSLRPPSWMRSRVRWR
jgi:Rrf2 family protein